ncbi:MAG TPA: fatty acid desaturase [Pseudomonadales bacterium]
MYKLYKKDPLFFIRYNVATILILGLASVLLYLNWSAFRAADNDYLLFLAVIPLALPNLWIIASSGAVVGIVAWTQGYFDTSLQSLVLLPLLGAIIGLQSAWLMHNASHESIKPAWLNRLVGELSGLQQLAGFPVWAVFHIVHHQNSDDPLKDPHPPGTLTFREYFRQMGVSTGRVVHNVYFELWGDNPRTQRLWRMTMITFLLARFTRAVFLLVLLGPTLFVLVLIVSKIVNYAWYIHFNYYTHQPNENGDMEVLNLNHNLYYKFMNATMAGIYFHKNHHRKASLFDPRTLEPEQADKTLISYKGGALAFRDAAKGAGAIAESA